MTYHYSRRDFLKFTGVWGAALALPNLALLQQQGGATQIPWLTINNEAWRTWTPRLRTRPAMTDQPFDLIGSGEVGFATGTSFSGRLVGFRGLQNARSHRYALLRRRDGRVRGYPLASFVDADREYLRAVDERTTAAITQRRDTRQGPDTNRTVEFLIYDAAQNGELFDLYETEHFAFYVGKQPTGDGQIVAQPGFIDAVLHDFEQVWDFFEVDLRFPMPFSDAARQPFNLSGPPAFHKINVYLTYTGLPQHETGWANAAREIAMNPLAMQEGSSLIPHEFTHVVQLYSNGFQNSPYVGYFWEVHANWCAHQFIPAFGADLTTYTTRMHQPLNWAGFRYASWMILQHLAEAPRVGQDFVRDLWLEVRRDPQTRAALEDPVQVIMRLGQERGILRGDATQAFGDLVAEMAARLVTFDYTFQQTYLDHIEQYTGENWLARNGTAVEAVPTERDYYRPVSSEQPGQWGIHHLALQATGTTIRVGIRTMTPDVSWRVCLVSHNATGDARYSEIVRDGPVSLAVNRGERVVLVVVAVPVAHQPLDFEVNDTAVQRYAYMFTVAGGAVL